MQEDPPRPWLSVCAICWNEEKYIRRWLEHFGKVADEIVVVRACGGVEPDATLDIAREDGCVTGIYTNEAHPEWPHVDNYAAARNKALDLAHGKWVMWADMDDVLPEGGAEAIRKFLRHVDSQGDEFDGVALNYQVPEDGLDNKRERIWRRGRARWRGRVHETLRFTADPPKLAEMDLADPVGKVARFVHAPTGGRQRNDERNLRILESIPEDERTVGDRFHLFQSLRAVGRVDEAVEVGIGLAGDPKCEAPERAEMFFSLAQLAKTMDERQQLFLQALATDPFRREPYGELALVALNQSRWKDALGYTLAMRCIPRTGEYLWTARDKYYRYLGEHLYAMALRANGRPEEAAAIEANWFTRHGAAITLVHATRGRPVQAWLARRDAYEAAADPDSVEHIFCIDEDDEISTALTLNRAVVCKAGRGPVAAWNLGASVAKGRILVQMSDDWKFPFGWDVMIRAELKDALEAGRPAVLAVGDGHRRDDLLCMAIVTRERLKQQGGMLFHPGFFSMFSDNWFTAKAWMDGVVVDARERVVFEHKHPTFGEGQWDETYRRTNAPKHYADGQELFDLLVRAAQGQSFSQVGQDTEVEKWFAANGERSRRYVDIGAYDGLTFSNTKRFEDLGWQGMCVEPMAESFEACRANRPGARCVRCAASDHEGTAVLKFHKDERQDWHGHALATLGEPDEKRWGGPWGEEEVVLRRMADVLPPEWDDAADGGGIDLLSVDCEGHDIEALRGWPWDRVKPRCVVVETVVVGKNAVMEVMGPLGYGVWKENGQDVFLWLERETDRTDGTDRTEENA